MPRLPNFERAILDRRKIVDYCLSPTHPRGRHKARVFREVLGIGPADADWLCALLLEALAERDAIEMVADQFGVRWRVDVPASRHRRSAVIRAIWIAKAGDLAPRFVTCWIA